MARWEALNSTGSVTSWKSTTTAYMMMAAVVSPAMFKTMPAMSRRIRVRGQGSPPARWPRGSSGRVVWPYWRLAHLVAGRRRGGDGAPIEGPRAESVTELLRGSK